MKDRRKTDCKGCTLGMEESPIGACCRLHVVFHRLSLSTDWLHLHHRSLVFRITNSLPERLITPAPRITIHYLGLVARRPVGSSNAISSFTTVCLIYFSIELPVPFDTRIIFLQFTVSLFLALAIVRSFCHLVSLFARFFGLISCLITTLYLFSYRSICTALGSCV